MLVNFEDHIRIISTSSKAEIGNSLKWLSKILTEFERLTYSQDSSMGYLTASPKYVGTGMSLHAQVYTATSLSESTVEAMLKHHSCHIRKLNKKHYSIESAKTLAANMSENDIVNLFIDCIERIMHTAEPEQDKIEEKEDQVQKEKEEAAA